MQQEIKNRYLIEEQEYSKGSLDKDSKAKIGGIIKVTNLNTNQYAYKEWKRYFKNSGEFDFDDRNYVIDMLMSIVMFH